MKRRIVTGWLCVLVLAAAPSAAADAPSKEAARKALRTAVEFFREKVSASGAYLWRYRSDLARGEGEGIASKTTAWVQPPGTPTVGGAFLFAYKTTGDGFYLQAARETARALARGQLESGGWDYRIEFDPKARSKYAYRVDGGGEDARNVTTLDDDTTQSAMRFVMRVDRALDFEDKLVHDAAKYALTQLLKAQYPNGAWPQRFSEPPDPSKHPVLKASYPESWPRTHPKKDYRSYYTFNDNTIADMIDTMFEAERIYDDKRFGAAARRGGDFILLAQMPEPQPAWAQQYNAKMHPAWARRFEPPAVTGGESQGVMQILLSLYRQTGEKKYLKPIPSALEYLRASRLPGGQLARFYELKTNRPLYFTKEYELTYNDDDLPTHYGFKVGSKLESIEAAYDRLVKADPKTFNPQPSKPEYKMSRGLAERARQVIEAMDRRGAWVEEGRLRTNGSQAPTDSIIETRTFVANVETLSKFIAASK